MLPHSSQFCIDLAQTFQKKLLNLFNNRSYAPLQLVEALAHASKPTTVVELSQEMPFQRSYSVINKLLNAFGAKSLVTKTINVGESIKTVQNSDPVAFSKITKPFSDFFFEMLPQEANRKFRLFALDATSTPRIHAHTLDDRSYVHQANQIGIPVTVGLEASVLTYLPEHSTGEANWQLPVSLERIPTDTTPGEPVNNEIAMAEMPVRQPQETPGDPGSSVPGIDAFRDPATIPQLRNIFRNVNFEYNSNLIKGQANINTINAVANYLRQNPRAYIFIEGHCDERDPEAYNLALGARRSNAVRNMLLDQGVNPDHLFTISYGAEKPLVMESHEEAWSQNRRAEFKIYQP